MRAILVPRTRRRDLRDLKEESQIPIGEPIRSGTRRPRINESTTTSRPTYGCWCGKDAAKLLASSRHTSACQAGDQRLLVDRAARRVPTVEPEPWAGLIGLGRPRRDVSRSRSLPPPGGPLSRDDPERTTRQAFDLPVSARARRCAHRALGRGAYPRLPRNLRPDSPLEMLTEVTITSLPSRPPTRNECRSKCAGRVYDSARQRSTILTDRPGRSRHSHRLSR
jgi:hypothetical protein